MTTDWQTMIAIAMVCLAAVVLLRRVVHWARGTGESGCGSCPNKNSSAPAKTLPLVQIQSRKPQ